MPNGDAILFVSLAPREAAGALKALSLRTGETKDLGLRGTRPHVLPTGHLVYATAEGTLEAVAFDSTRLEVGGAPVVVLDDVVVKNSGAADFAVSNDGLLIYLPTLTDGEGLRSLVWVDRDGQEEPLQVPPDNYRTVRISPDGRHLALDATHDIYVWDVARQVRTRLTFDPALDRFPVWTPDGSRILFASNRAGAYNLFWKRADNAGSVERLTESPDVQFPSSISRDGRIVIFSDVTGGRSNIHSVSLGPEPVVTMTANPHEGRNGVLSPEGRWLAYQSDESGQTEVWVRAFPDPSQGKWQISASGGQTPFWAPNGRELFGSPKVRVGHCANRTRGGRSRMLVQQSMIIPMSADAEWKP